MGKGDAAEVMAMVTVTAMVSLCLGGWADLLPEGLCLAGNHSLCLLNVSCSPLHLRPHVRLQKSPNSEAAT